MVDPGGYGGRWRRAADLESRTRPGQRVSPDGRRYSDLLERRRPSRISVGTRRLAAPLLRRGGGWPGVIVDTRRVRSGARFLFARRQRGGLLVEPGRYRPSSHLACFCFWRSIAPCDQRRRTGVVTRFGRQFGWVPAFGRAASGASGD